MLRDSALHVFTISIDIDVGICRIILLHAQFIKFSIIAEIIIIDVSFKIVLQTLNLPGLIVVAWYTCLHVSFNGFSYDCVMRESKFTYNA